MIEPTEIPDRWSLVHIDEPGGEPHLRIMSGWWGGYLGSDHWQLSSGCLSYLEEPEFYLIPQHSGSIYKLYKNCEGWTSYSREVYNRKKTSNWIIIPQQDLDKHIPRLTKSQLKRLQCQISPTS